MKMQLLDKTARNDALNTTISYIVQAPAGSGKTALLTQRFLALLATVNNPGEIIALTFTKKAASEMKNRIIDSIQSALEPPPTEPYLLTTYNLAKKVLEQDNKYQWDLLKQPTQLRIQTIDSLCHYLTSCMPLLAKSIHYSEINEDCQSDYHYAATQCIQTALHHPDFNEAAKIFLTHLANHHNKAVELLGFMLSRRDQWLSLVLKAKHLTKEDFENTLHFFQAHAIKNIKQQLSENEISQIHLILDYQALHLTNETNVDKASCPTPDFHQWQRIAKLFLTKDFTWRTRFTKREGFPAASSFKTVEEKTNAKHIKESIASILEGFEKNSELNNAFIFCIMTPAHAFTESQWVVLNALIQLLPLLVAELQLRFSSKSHVDFTEIASLANICLGDETPTDLNLYLDNQIKHLLIDEFQDTSISQFTLIEKLTRGWQHTDGRTLFIVGDPMQSIYRFRQAEVSLFLKARSEGLGDINLVPLVLSTNFRSTRTLIEWFNKTCKRIFPDTDNTDTGAISYSESTAINTEKNSHIMATSCENKIEEAQAIAACIKQYENKSIAILVSSRSQLSALMPTLAENGITPHGIDLEKLSDTSLIDTLCSLTKCILNPMDNNAFLSILLSPLCGIDYEPLYRYFITKKNLQGNQLLSLVNNVDIIPSDQQRIDTVIKLLNKAHEQRYRQPLSNLVKNCFETLNGKQLIGDKLSDVNAFWHVLGGVKKYPIDQELLFNSIKKLYSKNTCQSNINIMTIHKSKGLEFDVVILPSLDYAGKDSRGSLLEWIDTVDEASQRHLLLSPIKSMYQTDDAMNQFIRYIDKEKSDFEKKRLLYVALTRAKQHLLLFSSTQKETPKKGSFRHMLQDHIPFLPLQKKEACSQTQKYFERLPQIYFSASSNHSTNLTNFSDQTPIKSDANRIIGTFIHEQLYLIAENGVSKIQDVAKRHWQDRLTELGIAKNQRQEAITLTEHALNNLFDCPHGNWIMQAHPHAKNEYALSTPDANYSIDRTFVENDVRWIIDYKISQQSNKIDVTYIKQLEIYGELFQKMEASPIQLALYYPLEKRFFHWELTNDSVLTDTTS